MADEYDWGADFAASEISDLKSLLERSKEFIKKSKSQKAKQLLKEINEVLR